MNVNRSNMWPARHHIKWLRCSFVDDSPQSPRGMQKTVAQPKGQWMLPHRGGTSGAYWGAGLGWFLLTAPDLESIWIWRWKNFKVVKTRDKCLCLSPRKDRPGSPQEMPPSRVVGPRVWAISTSMLPACTHCDHKDFLPAWRWGPSLVGWAYDRVGSLASPILFPFLFLLS